MTTFNVTNNGLRSQAIKVRGGFHTVKPGETITVEPLPDLSEDRIDALKAKGLSFEKFTAVKAGKSQKAESNAAAEKAAQVAAEKAAALAAAEQAVKDAEAAVTAAGEDLVAKAAATEALDAASAALAALKA